MRSYRRHKRGERYWELFRAVGEYGEVQDIIPCSRLLAEMEGQDHQQALFWSYSPNEMTIREGKLSDQDITTNLKSCPSVLGMTF